MPTVEVFADVSCPFAHVALRQLVSRRDELHRSDLGFRVRAWPLELVNGSPLDSSVVAKEVEALQADAAPTLFSHFDPSRFPSTSLRALDLAEVGYVSSAELGERVSLAVRHALFEEGRDIADPAVLTGIATTFGLDSPRPEERQAVLRDWRAGQARGVAGSPHFFCGTESAFCPSLDTFKEAGRLAVQVNRGALDAFLAVCCAD